MFAGRALTVLLFSALAANPSENLTPFEANSKWGYKDARGKVVIEPRYDVANAFSAEGIASVADGSGWAYIDRTGRVVVRPFVVDNGPDEFAEGLARFVQAGKFGFFDKRGATVIPARLDFAGPFSGGLAAFCQGCKPAAKGESRFWTGGKWGFIDLRGGIVIPAKFDEAGSFERGRARVSLGGKRLAIDKLGREAKEKQ